ncbi:hypothetical protein ACN28I_21395 [Archangium gephyra]|uniref:hypothetical protein n=1 Tax=Archangium gephyra TaxID=48 RepID=UPI003B7D7ED0
MPETPTSPSVPPPAPQPPKRQQAALQLPRFVSPRGFALLWCVLGLVLTAGALAAWALADGVLALQVKQEVAHERR